MSASSTRARLLRACYAMMVPIARFLLRSGVGFKEFAEVSRRAFVDVASSDYGLRGRPTNISRVAAMTGIGRKEVKRLREGSDDYDETLGMDPGPLCVVLHRWYSDREYLDRAGRPRALRMQGRGASFENLVRRCTGDIPVGAVKVELIRSGSVREDAKGRLHALSRQMVPADLEEKLITGIVSGVGALASTVAFNTSVNNLGPAGRIQRLCLSEPIAEQSIKAMHPVLRRQIQSFANEMSDLLAQPSETQTGRRVGVGVFYYEDD